MDAVKELFILRDRDDAAADIGSDEMLRDLAIQQAQEEARCFPYSGPLPDTKSGWRVEPNKIAAGLMVENRFRVVFLDGTERIVTQIKVTAKGQEEIKKEFEIFQAIKILIEDGGASYADLAKKGYTDEQIEGTGYAVLGKGKSRQIGFTAKQAAEQLGLGTSEEVVALIEEIGMEEAIKLGYIEFSPKLRSSAA